MNTHVDRHATTNTAAAAAAAVAAASPLHVLGLLTLKLSGPSFGEVLGSMRVVAAA